MQVQLKCGVTLDIQENGAEGDEVILTFDGAKVVSVMELTNVDTKFPEDKPCVQMVTNVYVPRTD